MRRILSIILLVSIFLQTLSPALLALDDGFAAVLQSFTTTTVNGTYLIGNAINITANFDEPVDGASTMLVTLDIGIQVTLSGNGSTSMSGVYTISSGENSSHLTINSIDSATITTIDDTPSGITETSYSIPGGQNLGDTASIVIDGNTYGCMNTSAVNYNPSATIDDASCYYPTCGNSLTESSYDNSTVEQCDDGNGNNGDGCSSSCQSESLGCTNQSAINYNPGAAYDNGSCTYPTCGNFSIESSYNNSTVEQCDDGNFNNGDGCSSSCQTEILGCTYQSAVNYNPSANYDNGSCTYPICGNYLTESSYDNSTVEQCDDGNGNNGDGCSSSCQTEILGCTSQSAVNYNPSANYDNGSCTYPSCGNLSVESSYDNSTVEQCDDGNGNNGDGCSSSCQTEILGCMSQNATNYNPSANYDSGFMCTYPTCGNYLIESSYDNSTVEQCDDGNFSIGDGCNASCQIEISGCTNPSAINHNPSANNENGSCVYPICMNGVVESSYDGSNIEQCDDGNYTNNDGCNTSCQTEIITGCTHSDAVNHNPLANQDDGSCNYFTINNPTDNSTISTWSPDIIWGNNPVSCEWSFDNSNWTDNGCTNAITEPPVGNQMLYLRRNNGSYTTQTYFTYNIYGCMHSDALNYNPLANVDNGCVFIDIINPIDSTTVNSWNPQILWGNNTFSCEWSFDNSTWTDNGCTDAIDAPGFGPQTLYLRRNGGAYSTQSNFIHSSDVTPPTFSMQVYSNWGWTTPIADNAVLSQGTYYIKITANEALVAAPTIILDAEGITNDTSNMMIASISGNEYVYTYTIGFDSISIGSVLVDISLTGVDVSTNASTNVNPTNEGTKAFYIDTVSDAAPGTPDMTAGTDKGSSTDNITSDTTPDFTLSCVTGSTVTLYDNITSIGSGTCAGSTVTITASTLSEGTHGSINASQTDSSGNVSAASGNLSVTIDTTADAATGTPDMIAGTDTGSSNSDDNTADTTPNFTVSCVTGSVVTLYDNVTSIGSGTCAGGTVTITASALSEGTHASINASQTDIAGNVSVASANLSITVDTTADAATGTPDMTAGTDLGSSNTDNNTSDSTPDFTLSCVTGSIVTLYDNVTSIGTGTCAGGTLTITASTLSEGLHATIYATQSDTAGNISAVSGNLIVTIDTTVDAATGTPDMTAGTDLGSSNTDNNTSDSTPDFTISCVTGSVVTLYDNVTSIGTGTCAGSTVTIAASTLSEGTHATINASQTDTAGNTSVNSSALSVTVDTTAPILTLLSVDGDVMTPYHTFFTTPSVIIQTEIGDSLTITGWTCTPTPALSTSVTCVVDNPLIPGNYLLGAIATDNSGNVSSSLDFSITIDAVIISIPVMSSGGGLFIPITPVLNSAPEIPTQVSEKLFIKEILREKPAFTKKEILYMLRIFYKIPVEPSFFSAQGPGDDAPMTRIDAYKILLRQSCSVDTLLSVRDVWQSAHNAGLTVRSVEGFEPERAITTAEFISLLRRLQSSSTLMNCTS